MMFIKNLVLLSLVVANSASAETCEPLTTDGLRCVSETTATYAKCLLNDCPEGDQACTSTLEDGDTCDDVSTMCTGITNECCSGDCKCPLERLVECATLGVCEDITCGTEEKRRNLIIEDLPFVPRKLGGELSCLSESIREFTECVLRECPTADQVCGIVSQDEDTCDDVENTCTAITENCCPGCANEMKLLMDCSTGDLCDPFNCGSDQTQGGGGSAGSSKSNKLSSLLTMAAGASLALTI